MSVSIESTKLAEDLVRKAVKDKVLDNPDVMTARIAQALEASWQQGLDDADTFHRIMTTRKRT